MEGTDRLCRQFASSDAACLARPAEVHAGQTSAANTGGGGGGGVCTPAWLKHAGCRMCARQVLARMQVGTAISSSHAPLSRGQRSERLRARPKVPSLSRTAGGDDIITTLCCRCARSGCRSHAAPGLAHEGRGRRPVHAAWHTHTVQGPKQRPHGLQAPKSEYRQCSMAGGWMRAVCMYEYDTCIGTLHHAHHAANISRSIKALVALYKHRHTLRRQCCSCCYFPHILWLGPPSQEAWLHGVADVAPASRGCAPRRPCSLCGLARTHTHCCGWHCCGRQC